MAIKSSRGVTSGKGTPQRLEGQNGDMSIRRSSKGKHLFVKDMNKWHSVTLDVNSSQMRSHIDNLLKEVKRLKTKQNNRPLLDAAFLRVPGSDNIKLKNTDGQLHVRNSTDTDEVEIVARRVSLKQTETSSAPTITPKEGDLFYDSSQNLHYLSTGGIFCNAVNNLTTGQQSAIVLMANASDSLIKFYDEALGKWSLGYDKHGGTTFSDATCDTIAGNTTITMDDTTPGSDTIVVGMLVSGTEVATGTVVSAITDETHIVITPAAIAPGTNVTLTFAENDGRFKIDTSSALSDPSVFSLDTAGALELFGTSASLKLAYDATNYATLTTTSSADLLITTVGSGVTRADILLDADGLILLNSAGGGGVSSDNHISISAGKRYSLDGGNNTYITEFSADLVKHVVGGVVMLQMDENGQDGNEISFGGSSAGFTRQTTIFAAAIVTSEGNDSTDIDFRFGNKHYLLLQDNIAGSGEHINLIFPATSGNFLLLLVQESPGEHTVHSDGWKAYISDGSTLCGNNLGANNTDGEVRWAGGTAPTLTTTSRTTDIVSIYWDADTQTACATITQNF